MQAGRPPVDAPIRVGPRFRRGLRWGAVLSTLAFWAPFVGVAWVLMRS